MRVLEVHGLTKTLSHSGYDRGMADWGAASSPHARNRTVNIVSNVLERMVQTILTDELRREEVSKCPDRFSRRFACSAYPESLREMGVPGRGGNACEIGDILGEGGEFEAVFTVDAVVGLSFPRLETLDCKNALNMRGRELAGPETVPKDVEFIPI
jgi:hypothetical protein